VLTWEIDAMVESLTAVVPRWHAGYVPSANEVESLLEAARQHPLGERLLVEGPLDAVAALFGVHAFVIDAARELLA
jgi:hypothetical protein